MSAETVLARARAAGITLAARAGKLVYDAPAGALTPELLADLQEHKDALLLLLLDWTARPDVIAVVEDLFRERWHPDRIARHLGLTQNEVRWVLGLRSPALENALSEMRAFLFHPKRT